MNDGTKNGSQESADLAATFLWYSLPAPSFSSASLAFCSASSAFCGQLLFQLLQNFHHLFVLEPIHRDSSCGAGGGRAIQQSSMNDNTAK